MFSRTLFLLIPISNLIFTCSASCTSSQYYDQSTATCKPCDSSCKTCFGPSTNHCSSCLTGMTLSNNWCICGAGEFFHVQPQKCKSCHNQCAVSCTGSSPSE